MNRVETLISFFGDRRPGPAPAAAAAAGLTAEQAAVVAEACQRSAVVWLRPAEEGRPRLAWHAWHDGAVHVVYGAGEQALPMLTGTVEVTVPSKQTGARLVVFLARATILPSSGALWQEAAAALRAARLNTPDPDGQASRWAQGCLVSRLDPVQVLTLGPGGDDEPSGAGAVPDGPGTTTGRRPWHLRGRPQRRRRQRRAAGPVS